MDTETIERGWTVYTEDGKRAGDVVEAHPHYLLVSRGLLMVRDVYVPRYAVAVVEDRKVRLAITDERLRKMGWTAPPPPPPPSIDADDSTPRLVPPVDPEPNAFDASAFAPHYLATDDDAGAATADLGGFADAGDTYVADTGLGTDGVGDFGGFGPFEPLADDYADLGVLFGPSVEVDGEAHLAMQRLGEGPAIVFVHGWGVDRRVWDYLTLDLPSDYTVVTYDARGYGHSTAPWTSYDVARMSRDLRVLLRTLDLEEATLVGLDLGAAAALHYALNGGHRAARLVLFAPAVLTSGADEAGTDTTARQELLWDWRDELKTDRPQLAARLAALWAPDASDETRAWLRDGLLDAAPHALLRGLGALAMPDIEGSLAEVRLPTTVLCGRADPLVPLERAEELARAIPGATFAPLDTPGHLPMLTDPESVIAALRAAIEGEQIDGEQEDATPEPANGTGDGVKDSVTDIAED